ncbi:MAG: hypothetical protein JWO11_2567 [Nocardioides sp.]|nr:hypothetical protein [Nocardioides sp.]
MSDFESRVRDALGAGASGAPDASGLAGAARRLARTRRRTTIVVSVVAVLAVVAVPVGVLALRDSGDALSGPGIAKDPTGSTASDAPTRWRTETWRDLEIEVPASWGYGTLSTWCLNGKRGPGNPVVERPGGAVRSIGCGNPSSGYGVNFFDSSTSGFIQQPGAVEQVAGASQDSPDGAWTGYAISTSGDTAILVVAPTQAMARRILDSAHRVEGVDTNGCAPAAADAPDSGAADSVSVCRYTAAGLLEQSERLTGPDASDAVAALEAAPETGDSRLCPAPLGGAEEPSEYALLLAGDEQYTVQWTGSACPNWGVFWGDTRRALTADVMYWALSPGWSGVVDGDVPLPPDLRH